jgi:hypothetical protein
MRPILMEPKDPQALAAAIVASGKSTARLGAEAGCSKARIGTFRQAKGGRCSSLLARRLARALDAPLDEFFMPALIRARTAPPRRRRPAA